MPPSGIGHMYELSLTQNVSLAWVVDIMCGFIGFHLSPLFAWWGYPITNYIYIYIVAILYHMR